MVCDALARRAVETKQVEVLGSDRGTVTLARAVALKFAKYFGPVT